jgi:hypothetical protein
VTPFEGEKPVLGVDKVAAIPALDAVGVTPRDQGAGLSHRTTTSMVEKLRRQPKAKRSR